MDRLKEIGEKSVLGRPDDELIKFVTRADVDWLIAEVERLRKENEALRSLEQTVDEGIRKLARAAGIRE